MTQTLNMTHRFGAYTLTLDVGCDARGPEIYMRRSLMVMGMAKEGLYVGGLVYSQHLSRNAAAEARSDIVYFYVKDVVDAKLLIEVLTNPTAGLMVDASDAAADVAGLRGWLRDAIRQGKEWLEEKAA